jgi:hypothetical protein
MKTFGGMIEWKIQSNGLKTNILFNWFLKIKILNLNIPCVWWYDNKLTNV